MKRIMLLLMTTLMITMLCACSGTKTENTEDDMNITDDETVNASNDESKDTDDENEPEVELVTKEWIMEYFDFSEKELEGIDVDAVIQYCQYTEEILKLDFYTKEYLLDSLQFYNEQARTYIGYLFEGGQPEEKIPVSQIKTVAFLEGENEANYYWQINISEKKAYYCIGYSENMDLEEYCGSDGTIGGKGPITDEYIAELLDCLDKANLHKWKEVYNGNNGNTTGDFRWDLGIELTDGTVYSWGGCGMFGDNKPEEYQLVYDAIDAVYYEIETES